MCVSKGSCQTPVHGRDTCVVSGTNRKISVVIVICRLGKGSEFIWIKRHGVVLLESGAVRPVFWAEKETET